MESKFKLFSALLTFYLGSYYESLQLEGNELNKNMKTLQAVRFISFVVLSIPNGVLIA
jgi:hypothetical protein